MRYLVLVRHLLRVGRAAGTRTAGGATRALTLCLAVVCLAVGAASLVLTNAVYDHRQAVSEARNPIPATGSAEPELLWAAAGDLVSGLQVSVVALEPLTKDAPLPPGLAVWPEPGEAFLSPHLRETGAAEGITTRYGKDAGDIASTGLASDSEDLVYVRPKHALAANPGVVKASGFGPTGATQLIGEAATAQPADRLLGLSVFFLLLPACGLMVIAVRTAAAGRDRRQALLDALGAGPGPRLVMSVGECLVPVVCGALLAEGLFLSLGWSGLVLPHVDYQLSPLLTGGVQGALAGCAAGAALTVTAAAVLFDQAVARRSGGTRPATVAGGSALMRRTALIFPVFLATAVWGPLLLGDSQYALLVPFFLGSLGTLASLPAVLGVVLARAGGLVGTLGARLGHSALLVSGRRVQAHPAGTVRLVTGIVLAIGVAGVSEMWVFRADESVRASLAAHERLGRISATIEFDRGTTQDRLDAFLAAARQKDPSAQFLAVGDIKAEGHTPTQLVTGDCAALSAADTQCPGAGETAVEAGGTDLLAQLTTPMEGIRVEAVEGRITPDAASSLLVFTADRSPLDLVVLKQTAHAELPGRKQVESFGFQYAGGIARMESQRAWIPLYGVTGVAVTAIGLLLAGIAEVRAAGRALAPLGVLTGRRRFLGGVAGWLVLAPALLAVALATLVTTLLGFPLTQPKWGSGDIPYSMVWAAAAVLTSLAAAATLWGWRTATKESHRWRPAGD
ncbi:hypothetical protein ABZ590_24510 [Streptomyces hirsutus]|uniref:hypothetical protein n=1 Tax=Streptomyces hirsutus TaxID=35620 RepID=UPI0033E5628D